MEVAFATGPLASKNGLSDFYLMTDNSSDGSDRRRVKLDVAVVILADQFR